MKAVAAWPALERPKSVYLPKKSDVLLCFAGTASLTMFYSTKIFPCCIDSPEVLFINCYQMYLRFQKCGQCHVSLRSEIAGIEANPKSG